MQFRPPTRWPLCTRPASRCHHVLSVSIFFHLHLLNSSYYLYIYTHAHRSSAIANTPTPLQLCSLHGGQLRLSSLMRVDGVVWAVELTTFTGLNENDPSSLAGLSPHWPNFIMANYQSRPLLFWCMLGTGPHLRSYTDTLDTVLIRQNTARRGGAGIDDLAKKGKKEKNYRCDVCVCATGWTLREKRGFKMCLKCKEREEDVCVVYWVSSYLASHSPVVVLCVDECRGI